MRDSSSRSSVNVVNVASSKKGQPILDMKKENSGTKIIIPEEGLLLESNKLYLGRTIEYTETDNFIPMLEGRSSVGR